MLNRMHIICVCAISLAQVFSLRVNPAYSHFLPVEKEDVPGSSLLAKKEWFIGDPLMKADTPSCSIPFTMAGKLILIKAKADTTEGNFILDTGSPNLVLNTTYFRDYPVDQQRDELQQTITGQADEVQRTTVNWFRLGTINYYKVQTDLASLRHLENSKGVKILGLLGLSLFKECEIIIDYKNSMIHLHYISKKERKTYQHEMLKDSARYTSYPFDIKNNRILVNVRIADKELPFVVDYAAESNIIDSRLPGKILDSVIINGRIVLTGVGLQKVEAITGDLSNLNLGALAISHLPFIITNLERTCFGQDLCIEGVLGYEFLSRYTLVFNFVKRKLYLLK